MQRSMVVRQVEAGKAEAIFQKYIDIAIKLTDEFNEDRLVDALSDAVDEFNAIPVKDVEPKVVGLIGEIYIKYNQQGQMQLTKWMQEQGIEVVVPSLMAFLVQGFVNNKVNHKGYIERTSFMERLVTKFISQYVHRNESKMEKVKRRFRYYRPEGSIFEMADDASKVLNLANQFGEGWLIAGEVMELSRQGVKKVVCLQPFGCIANHIVARGIENRLKKVCPETALLFLDIDSSVAKVNLENRLHFLIDQAEDGL